VPLPSWLRLRWLSQQLPFQPITHHENVGQQQGKGVLWVDFDQIGDWDEMRRVFAEINLPDFEFAMLGHLIVCVGPDVPGVEGEDWYDADVARRLRGGAGVRYLKAFALREAIAEAPIADRDLPRIYRREVFFLVSDCWIITRRPRGMSWMRGIPDDERNSVDYDELMRTLEERWRNSTNHTTRRRLCCGFSPTRGCRQSRASAHGCRTASSPTLAAGAARPQRASE
jgi:hypothetical protein